MLDVHWRSLLPELSESRDEETLALERRYMNAEAKARREQSRVEKQAQVISLSWARNERRFKRAR